MTKFLLLFISVFFFLFAPLAAADENRVKRLLVLYTPAIALDWTADGSLILTASLDTVRLWNAETQEERYSLKHGEILNGVLFNPTGDRFLTWSNQIIHTWDTQTGHLLGTLSFNTNGGFSGVLWHGDQVVSWIGGDILLWDGVSEENNAGFFVPGANFNTYPQSISWNHDLTRFVAWDMSTSTPSVSMWQITGDFEDITPVMSFPHGRDPVFDSTVAGVAWSPDETMIASWSADRVMIWDAKTGELLTVLNKSSYIFHAYWSPNSRDLLVEDINKTEMRVWDVSTSQEVMTLPATDASWDTTGERLLVGRVEPDLLAVPSGNKLAEFGSDMGIGFGLWNTDGIRYLVQTGVSVQVWVIPPQDRCVVYALSPTNLRAAPGTDSERVDILPPHHLATVTDHALDSDQNRWLQLDSAVWVRADLVQLSGLCP